MLQDKLKDKEITIDNLIDVIRMLRLTKINVRERKNNKQISFSKGYDDVVGELLESDELHSPFQKLKDQQQS